MRLTSTIELVSRNDRKRNANWLMPAIAIFAILVGLFRPEIRSFFVDQFSFILGWVLDLLIVCAVIALIWWVVSTRKQIEKLAGELQDDQKAIKRKLDDRVGADAAQEEFAKSLEERINTHNSRMTGIDSRLNVFDSRLNAFDSRQNSLETRLNAEVSDSQLQNNS